MEIFMNTERIRLREARDGIPWKKWGPYLSERQWGTVREDYSEQGNAWDYFTHDQARSRAYRWGEDGIAGISDDKQHLCFALAFWNERDSILKERLFGLTNSEGNHGEDVKEYYYYLDNTPTHSYMKYLYKYPQKKYPYSDLVKTNKSRTRNESEYELIDTGIFNENRYFDIFVEYAKENPEEILVKITICNRCHEAAKLHVLPTMWFRNEWSEGTSKASPKPLIKQFTSNNTKINAAMASHYTLGDRYMLCEGEIPLLFTDNITNNFRIFPGHRNQGSFFKDGINNFIVNGQQDAINPEKTGTKVSAHYQINVEANGFAVIKLRLTNNFSENKSFGDDFNEVFTIRKKETDEFYQLVTPPSVSQDAANIMRQALAGMLWSKQYYYFDADYWLKEHHAHPLNPQSKPYRNREWFHMINDDIISMPDKWEYPWYAAWDLAFHTLPLAIVDLDFAKEQLKLILRGFYLHPSGQIPAYEWNFSDVNPPVHAWASIFVNRIEKATKGEFDLDFLNLPSISWRLILPGG